MLRAKLLPADDGRITLVGTNSIEYGNNATSWSISTSGIRWRVGDLLIITDMSNISTTDCTFDDSYDGQFTDYTGNKPNARTRYKFLTSGDDDTWTGSSGSAINGGIVFVMIIRNATTGYKTSAIGTSGMPNPPSNTPPAAGFVVSDWCLVIGALDDDWIIATAPTDYTLIGAVRSDTLANSSYMAAYKLIESAVATEDPGAFGGAGTDEWVAWTTRLYISAT